MLTFDTSSLDILIPQILELNYFKNSEEDTEGALLPTFYPGEGKLLVVTGENATGKSFFRRLLTQALRQSHTTKGIEVIPISLQGRTTGGNPMKAFIYGGEEDSSTGANSVMTVATAIKTCQGRTQPHAIIWDEPDIGLSDNFAAGVGQAISNFVSNTPELTQAIMLVSHRKCLIQEVIKNKPHHLHLGNNRPKNLQDWHDQKVTPRNPNELQEENFRMLRAIGKYEKRK